jgi:hypothetical protein
VINANEFEFAFVEIRLKPAPVVISRRRRSFVTHGPNDHRFDGTITTFDHPRTN